MKYHLGVLISIGILAVGCVTRPKTGQMLKRSGDEIVVAGQFIHTGAPVVLWMDPGGYDAYRTERRFVPWEKASYAATTQEARDIDSPNRYGVRFAPRANPEPGTLTPEELETVRGGGWDLKMAQDKIDQFVMHYDVCGTARQCFNILHDHRGLSVHFMLDVDGTIYQTLDVKERGFHATKANSRSVGIEIANIGAYPPDRSTTLDQWYRKDPDGKTRMVLPAWMKQEWIRTPNFVARPARNEAIIGEVQRKEYKMYDLTPQQYDSLIKLTAALCKTLPKIKCDYPRDENGKMIPYVLTEEQYSNYQGVLGHFHVQANKQDPGPAFQWDKVIEGARKLMK